MAIAGSLIIQLEARTQQLQNELNRARGLITRLQRDIAAMRAETASTERQITQNARRIGDAFGGVTASVTRATSALTALVSVGTAVQALRIGQKALESADALGDMADQLDVNVEQLQRLQIAAQRSGSSADGMNRALAFLQNTLGEAARGSTEAQQRFADLGLRWQELRSLPIDQVLLAVADALTQFETQSDKAARMAGVLGDRSKALVALMSQGSVAIQAAGRALDIFGAILNSETVAALGQANDRLTDLATIIDRNVARAVGDLVPVLLRTIETMTNLVVTISRNNEVMSALGFAGDRVIQTLQDITQIAALLERTVASVTRAWQTFLSFFGLAAPSTIQGVTNEITLLTQALETAARAPAAAQNVARIADMTAKLKELQAQRAAMLTAPITRPETLPPVVVPGERERPTVRAPFPVPGRDGRAAKSITDTLAEAARRAAGETNNWTEAIQRLEQEMRTLEPATPIVKDLDEAARRAGISFSSWQDAIQSLEQDIRSSVTTAGDFSSAIARANEAILQATTATRDSLAGQAEALNELYQTPLARLQELEAQLMEMQGLLDRGVSAKALRDAQIAYARTTLAGEGLVLVANGISEAFDQSFQAVIAGTLSVSEAFRNLAQSILLSISKILLQKGVETLLGVALAGIGAGAGGAAPVGGAGGFQRGGVVPGRRGMGDIVPALLTPGEFVVRRQAVDAIGVTMLAKLNALSFQQGGPVLPPLPSVPGMGRQEPPVSLNVIVVRSDQEAMAKKAELESFDQRVIAVISRNIQAGDGSLVNRSLNMVRGPRG